MFLIDVNVLVYAHREDADQHVEYLRWIERLINSEEAYGVSELVLSGFLRIVTHPKIFQDPSPLKLALNFTARFRDRPNAVAVNPGERHWRIFTRLCRDSGARGNLVSDAYLAALAIESGSTWITTDRDYARFSGLRWRHPFK
ncbi:MAG: type II toxin-antitoxin system VapC family toxin [Acidobacteriota bacterium]